jgi:hypothetical protein
MWRKNSKQASENKVRKRVIEPFFWISQFPKVNQCGSNDKLRVAIMARLAQSIRAVGIVGIRPILSPFQRLKI